MYFFDGTKYEGQFKIGKREGRGIRTYEDGTKFVGDWYLYYYAKFFIFILYFIISG